MWQIREMKKKKRHKCSGTAALLLSYHDSVQQDETDDERGKNFTFFLLFTTQSPLSFKKPEQG